MHKYSLGGWTADFCLCNFHADVRLLLVFDHLSVCPVQEDGEGNREGENDTKVNGAG